MLLRARKDRRTPAQPLPLHWRRCAALLLFIFVWDIGFEFLASFHLDQDSSREVRIGAAETEHHPDCGLPDHGCALSHHHHFPALLTTAHAIVLPSMTKHLSGTLPVSVHHRATQTLLIRGPPVAL